ncbi:MAG TPA: DUF445 family protein [Spirochaetia bacterium]|nr:DUF445 family protein [Spirochaetales bacterium]HRY80730.1 DUF445 family protein [Spirochaetia bacterium]
MIDRILRWLLPALVGGVIGYVTNWLAIKMLFRPLTEKKVFGIRIPFTPGILPRERHALALSLGDVVSRDLLTEDVLTARFESEELRDSVTRAVRSLLDDALDRRVSEVRSAASSAEPLLAEAAGRAYGAVSSSEAFRRAAASAVREGLGAARGLRLKDILSPGGRSLVSEWFRVPGRAEFTAEKAREAVRMRLEAAASEGKSLGDLLPLSNLARAAGAAFDSAYPSFVSAARAFLARPDVRKELERYGGAVVRKALGRLSPLQRLFVGAAQYDKAVLESLPATVADLAEAAESFLADERNRERFKSILLDRIQRSVEDPLASRPREHPLSPVSISDLAFRSVRALGERGAAGLGGTDLLGAGTLGDLLESLGPEAREGLFEAVGSWIAGFFASGSGGTTVGTFARAFADTLMDGLGDASLGAALGWDGEFRDRLARYLAEKGTAIAARESRRILASIDLRRMVVEKVDALDMLVIEGIMLRVMSKEFKGITVLGGILGALIGALQPLLELLRP